MKMVIRKSERQFLLYLLFFGITLSNLGISQKVMAGPYTLFGKGITALQALGNQKEIFFFVDIDWTSFSPPDQLFQARPFTLAKERHVIQFDGKTITKSVHIRSLNPSESFNPRTHPIMRFENSFIMIERVSGNGTGTAYIWNGLDFIALEPKDAARIERECKIKHDKSSIYNKPLMDFEVDPILRTTKWGFEERVKPISPSSFKDEVLEQITNTSVIPPPTRHDPFGQQKRTSEARR